MQRIVCVIPSLYDIFSCSSKGALAGIKDMEKRKAIHKALTNRDWGTACVPLQKFWLGMLE